MFGILSLILALPALFLVSGVLDIPPFYGMTAGLVACTAAVVELMGGGEEVRPIGKRAAFFGLVGGGVAVLIGLVLYVGAWVWASG